MDVVIPTSMEELLNCHGAFTVSSTWEMSEVSEGGVEGTIQGQMDVSCTPGGLILGQSNITDWWCIIKGFDHLSAENKCLAADTLIELVTKSLDLVGNKLEPSGRNSVKILMYYLQLLVQKFEAVERSKSQTDMAGKKKSKKSRAAEDELNWLDFRPGYLELFERVLRLDQSLLWTMGIIQENFMSGLWGIPLALLEDRPLGVGGTGSQEQSVRAKCMNIIALCTEHMGSNGCTALTTAAVDALSRSDHMDKFVADICRRSASNLSSEVISEIGKMNMTEMGRSGNGVKNMGSFLITYAEYCPEDMAVRLPVIMHQLDSDVWNIRASILTAMGHVVAFIHSTCEISTPGSADGMGEGGDEKPKKNVEEAQQKDERDDGEEKKGGGR